MFWRYVAMDKNCFRRFPSYTILALGQETFYSMIELNHADSRVFDYSLLKDRKIDLIFTNPPTFNSDNLLFANNIEQHVARMLTWFRSIMEIARIPLAYIHLTSGYFIHIIPGHEKIIKFPVREVKYRTSNWYTIAEADLEMFFKKQFKHPKGRILLDPFCGTGRIISVAQKFGMSCIGIEKDSHELEIAKQELEAYNESVLPKTNR